jgi:ABC-type uncharacterized transport system permease subunit
LTATVLALLATAGYAAATAAYIVDFVRRRAHEAWLGPISLLAALAFHTAWIVAAHVQLGQLPIATPYHALSLTAWGLALAYAVIESRMSHRGLGAFVVPIAFSLQALAVVFGLSAKPPDRLNPILHGVWFELHVGAALFSYCAFAVACAAGLMHILLNHELRLKRLGFFFQRMPPLHVLEQINHQALALGFLFLTVGIGAGVIWGLTSGRAGVLVDSKEISAFLIWLLYAANIHMRWRHGWRGQRSAIFSVANFAFLVVIFVVTSFVLQAHRFYQ